MVKSVSVAYCGGCNAAYDRVRFVRSLLDDLAATGCAIRLADMTEPVDIALIVAGCRAICVAERADFGPLATTRCVIGPDSLDAISMPLRKYCYLAFLKASTALAITFSSTQ